MAVFRKRCVRLYRCVGKIGWRMRWRHEACAIGRWPGEETIMSFSMLEPEETPVCECRYDEARDAMDREDCPFHRDLVDETDVVEVSELGLRRPPGMAIFSRTVASRRRA